MGSNEASSCFQDYCHLIFEAQKALASTTLIDFSKIFLPPEGKERNVKADFRLKEIVSDFNAPFSHRCITP